MNETTALLMESASVVKVTKDTTMIEDNSSKEKALAAALSQIERQFG